MTRGHPEALTSQEGELAQRVDVQLHAEPQRGADECGAHVVLAVRRRYGTLPAARACWECAIAVWFSRDISRRWPVVKLTRVRENRNLG